MVINKIVKQYRRDSGEKLMIPFPAFLQAPEFLSLVPLVTPDDTNMLLSVYLILQNNVTLL